jgi:hypothetical protein
VRQRKVHAWHRLPDHFAGDALVSGIGVGVQEADRDRLDAFGLERLAGRGHARLLQRLLHLAAGEQTLVHLVGVAARHQRLMPVKEQVVGFRPVAAADDVDVAGAARHDEAGLGALPLDQRVDRGGRAVNELVDPAGVDAAFLEAVDDALGQFGRRGQALGLYERLRLVVEADQVREGAADINRNEDHDNSNSGRLVIGLVSECKLRFTLRGGF